LQDSIFSTNGASKTQAIENIPIIEQPETTVKTHSYSHNKTNGRSSRRNSRKKSRNSSVTINDGQTLSEIAKKHHTTVSKLRKLNKIKGSSIRAGKKIRVK
jgi:membrane-bound lytic murein transglycosylase D